MNPDWELDGVTETMGAWSSKHKEEWLLYRLYELAKLKGSNTFELTLADVLTPHEWMDDPINGVQETLFYSHEQRQMLEVFAFHNILRIEGQTDSKHLSIHPIEKTKPEHSMYVKNGYKTIRDVLLNADLRESLSGIILRAYGVTDARELNRSRSVKTEVDERWDGLYQDEKILLLEALGIAKADWEGMKTQTHRTFGNRLISVSFDGEKVGNFTDILLGKKSLIEKRALKLIAECFLKARPDMTGDAWYDFFVENGVPSSVFPTDSHNHPLSNFIYETLLILASTDDERDKRLLEKVLSETVHPLFYKGDDAAANKQEQELNKLLKYSGMILRGGRLLLLTDEQSSRASNKTSVIKPQALEQVSWIIKDLGTASGLNDLFTRVGVPESAFPFEPGSKQRLVHGVLTALSTSGREEDKTSLFRIFEEISHPLNFGGDSKKAKEITIKITTLIRYDGLSLIGGSIHPFSEKDEAIITSYEQEQREATSTLPKNLSGIFGGNIFESAFSSPAKKPVAPQVPVTQQNKQQEVPAMHVHIHNDHQVTQSIQIPTVNQETEHALARTESKGSLKDTTITFDDDLTSIVVDGKSCKLPPHKNEHLFCRAAFEYKKGESIDWSVISEKITGKQWGESADEEAKKDKRTVIDTMYAINKRVAEVFNTEDQLFSWSEKTVTRMF